MTQRTEQERIGSVAVGDSRECETCNGRGEVGGHRGQTAESYEEYSEPCPSCTANGFLHDLASRLRRIPVSMGVDGHDIDRLLALSRPAQEPVAWIERAVLKEIAKHWSATGTVCSPLFRHEGRAIFDKVALYATPQPLHTTNCCKCGRIIDTREKKDGGDDFGAQLSDGRWTCSIECDDAVINPTHSQVAGMPGLLTDPAPSVNLLWLPIAQADKTITNVEDFSEVGITISTSDRYWVRDEDGRVYEAAWSEGNRGDRDYWWDFEGESPVDPVEFAPHPLDPKYAAVSEGSPDA